MDSVKQFKKRVHIGQISSKDEYIGFSIVNTAEEWLFDGESDNTPIDDWNWIPWFKLTPVKNLCIEKTDESMDMHFLKILIGI